MILDTANTVLAESDGQYEEENQNLFCVTVVGIEEPTQELGLDVFPNPANALLTLRFSGFDRVERVSLVDATGRAVYTHGGINGRSTLAMDISALANGIYTLVAEEEGARVVRRVVVQH